MKHKTQSQIEMKKQIYMHIKKWRNNMHLVKYILSTSESIWANIALVDELKEEEKPSQQNRTIAAFH